MTFVAALALAALPADPASALAARLDRLLEADWAARGVKPAAPADDAEFLRRAYLDLLGRAPRVAETRAFLADADPAKRTKLIDRLLVMPGHARHFAATTRTDWLPQADSDNRFFGTGDQFEGWLRDQYRANTPADEVVRRLLGAKLGSGSQIRFGIDGDGPPRRGTDPVRAFYEANEFKPEQLAAAASRLFLGVKLECAQCHDHPFAPLSREQFWQMAAFFGDFAPLPPVPPSFVGPLQPQYTKNRIAVPNADRTVAAVFFDGEVPEWTNDREPREELGRWIAAADNPFFARNVANRTWARFFGIGIVDPVDEPGDANPPSHPEVLDELAKGFAAAKFDNRFLIRVITRTKAYQLTSRLSHPTQADARRFARMPLKGLTGGQIYDSFVAATGYKGAGFQPNEDFFDPRGRSPRGQFQKAFPGGKPTEARTSILQALMMMNGAAVADQTTLATSEVLAAVADAPFLSTEGRVETLFLAALTRFPTPDERERFASYVDRGGPSGDKQKALADVFWALLNSTEFLFNH
jgi:hypothetical protein